MVKHKTIQVIAWFEASKGILVLLAATGLLSLLHHDLHEVAANLVRQAHLNPAAKYPRIFIDAASNLHDSHLLWLALGAAAYSVVRLVEAYGLLRERAWAELLAAGSGALYVPLEVLELWRHATWLRAALLIINLAVVIVMVTALLQRKRLPSDV